MPLVVETGAALSTADAYITLAYFRTQAAALGLDYLRDGEPGWLTDAEDEVVEAAIRRGTQAIDAYATRFIGRRRTLEQALEWPRAGAIVVGLAEGDVPPIMYSAGARSWGTRRSYSYSGVYAALGGVAGPGVASHGATLPADAVPTAVGRATVLAAARELAEPGSLRPDQTDRDMIGVGVGPINVQYDKSQSGPAALPRFPEIEASLRIVLAEPGTKLLLRG